MSARGGGESRGASHIPLYDNFTVYDYKNGSGDPGTSIEAHHATLRHPPFAGHLPGRLILALAEPIEN